MTDSATLIAMLGQRAWIAGVLVAIAAAPASADSRTQAPSQSQFVRACSSEGIHCGVHIRMRDGVPFVPIDVENLAPSDLQTAYKIDPGLGSGVTVAIVDAYSYPELEADLAMYRSRYMLPACTKKSGCLRVLNDQGAESPLPTGTDAGWEAETALDLDMVSAACPLCNILVIETDAGKLDAGIREAALLVPDAISASWGSTEGSNEASREVTYNHPGIGGFAASGDMAYDTGGMGPEYPATSAFVVGVGGTKLNKNPASGAFTETAWSLAGSSCSNSIPAPSYQPANATAACAMRASSDLSAEADPDTGVAVYESSAGGWLNVGGTSAATPLVAAMFAAAGHGDLQPGFIYAHPEAFSDIVNGNNGNCANALCDAGSGWDGPTGLGSPNQAMLAAIGNGTDGPAIAISSPADGSTEDPGFAIAVTAGSDTAHVDLAVDGVRVAAFGAPFAVTVPSTVANGKHELTLTAYDADHNATAAMLAVDIEDSGCSAGGTGGAGGIGLTLLGVGLVTRRRRRRIFPLNM